jgi:hypothetical protein
MHACALTQHCIKHHGSHPVLVCAVRCVQGAQVIKTCAVCPRHRGGRGQRRLASWQPARIAGWQLPEVGEQRIQPAPWAAKYQADA